MAEEQIYVVRQLQKSLLGRPGILALDLIALPYMAMLTYRSTPLSSGFSPAELLMSRRLHANLPKIQSQLQPPVPDFSLLKAREEEKEEEPEKSV